MARTLTQSSQRATPDAEVLIPVEEVTVGGDSAEPQQLCGTFIRTMLSRLEVDRAVVYGVLTRVWMVMAGPVTILVVASWFSAEVRGYFYTFSSLLGVQVFVELGLSQVIIPFASHEWSRLRLDGSGRIAGHHDAVSRLISIGHITFLWYLVAGLLLAVGLGAGGYVFFSSSPDQGIRWAGPWLLFCAMAGVKLMSLPLFSILEGCNQVARVYGFRLAEAILRHTSLWVAILLGTGLWSAGLSITAINAAAVVFIYLRYRRFFRPFTTRCKGPKLHWKSEMWPMQWKIASSCLAGYFSIYFFTPVLFKYKGSVEAGRMGMTWSLMLALSAVASTWVLAKAPRFGVLIAQKKYEQLDRLMLRTTTAAVIVAAAGALIFFLGIYALNMAGHPLADCLLGPVPTAVFLAATVLMQVCYAQSSYLRAHKQEPFLVISVPAGLLIGVLTIVFGRAYGANGMAWAYLAVTGLFIIPAGTLIWLRCRRKWHAEAPAE
jgi:hypothetical protein